MSFLRADDRSSRGLSTSATRDRSRSRSSATPRTVPANGYAPSSTMPSSTVMPGSFGNGTTAPSYEVRTPHGAANGYPPAGVGATPYPAQPSMPVPPDDGRWSNYIADLPPHQRPGYVPAQARHSPHASDDDRDLAYGDTTPSPVQSRHSSYSAAYPSQAPYPGQASQTAVRYTPQPVNRDLRSGSSSYQYAQQPSNITYTEKPQDGSRSASYTQSVHGRPVAQLPRTYSNGEKSSSYSQEPTYVDITPGGDQRHRASSAASQSHRLSINTQLPGLQPPRSPGLAPRPDRLSVGGDRLDVHALDAAGGLPPPSPLLEAYHGTYQSLSPMPLALRPDDDDDISDFESLSPTVSRNGRKDRAQDKLGRDVARHQEKKRVTVYDAEEDARKIAKALNHHNRIDVDPIIDILPGLSHDQIWDLRKQYKKQVKIQGKGINLPKHLKMKIQGNFGKVAYVTALGRWESEGYWANFWYQSHGSRRELLIESLMGRTNAEIRNIKDEFKDKRYSDSLTRCMEKELKMDKFRTAVLLALDERRQEEQDVYPVEYRNRDVDTLHRALVAKQGGESAMLEIVVLRSDAHLREVLKTYERMYQENFARAALKKSNNLVGEIIAHILNGVINKPARDALLLHHAIQDIAARNKEDELRYELLISRLVRLHWDKMHLMRVKRTYAENYRKELQQDIEDATKGDFREFMCELCETK